jgi:hypothetical protein
MQTKNRSARFTRFTAAARGALAGLGLMAACNAWAADADRPPTVLDTGQGAQTGVPGVVWETAPFDASHPAAPATNGELAPATRRYTAQAVSPGTTQQRQAQPAQPGRPAQPAQPARPAEPAQAAESGGANGYPIQVIVAPQRQPRSTSTQSTAAPATTPTTTTRTGSGHSFGGRITHTP